MRLAFVNHDPPGSPNVSGALQSATLYMRALADRGHEVTAFCTKAQFSERDPPAGVEVEPLPDYGGVTYSQRVARALAKEPERFDGCDVVHSYDPSAVGGLAVVGQQTRAGLVQTLPAYRGVCPKDDLLYRGRTECSGTGPLKCAVCAGVTTTVDSLSGIVDAGKRIVGKTVDRRLIESGLERVEDVDCFHVYADHIRRRYEQFGYPSDSFEVIPSLVDERFYTGGVPGNGSPYRLLFAGRLSHDKGVDQLIPMMSELGDDKREYHLTIAGDGPLRDELDSRVSDAGVSELVSLPGYVAYEEMPELYRVHDIFVYPGRWEEPFARVFLESLASGTPVVATDVSCVGDTIGDAGVTVEQTVSGLVEGVRTMTCDRSIARTSAAARERAERYSTESILDELEEMYANTTAK